MPGRWTIEEEKAKRKELADLYYGRRMNIGEISQILGIAESTVFDRMQRLQIRTDPTRQLPLGVRKKIVCPNLSPALAEFCGIMLGDGHISPSAGQIFIYLDSRADAEYIFYVQQLIERLFKVDVSLHKGKNRATTDLYVTSLDLVDFLDTIGLSVSNKVKDQVQVPRWIFQRASFQTSFVKGFFDADGSIHRLRFGVQMNFRNRSIPLLRATRKILMKMGYRPSQISSFSVFLTRKNDIERYITEIGFGNPKHFHRALQFGIAVTSRVGTQAANEGRL